VIPIYNQDGRQAKNRKKGDEVKKKNSLRNICLKAHHYAYTVQILALSGLK
jgi:hypothetical protein